MARVAVAAVRVSPRPTHTADLIYAFLIRLYPDFHLSIIYLASVVKMIASSLSLSLLALAGSALGADLPAIQIKVGHDLNAWKPTALID